MEKIIITGGAGFIGSHVTESIIAKYPNKLISVVDKLTYAADYNYLASVSNNDNFDFYHVDITNHSEMLKITKDVSIIINLAAESHVDHSFTNSLPFTQTNTIGTHVLLDCCLVNKVNKFIHISTDEVYGENNTDISFDEHQSFNPTNPYSASKAAAEMIIQSYSHSYGLMPTIVRANNIYGPRQYPEKLIPRTFLRLKAGLPALLHGNGRNRRCFLHVEDFCEALLVLLEKDVTGVFNIASSDEFENREVVALACQYLELDYESSVKFVDDRPHNDTRYLINSNKILSTGWHQKLSFTKEIDKVFDWYAAQNYSNLKL